jgi:hypothetical protein
LGLRRRLGSWQAEVGFFADRLSRNSAADSDRHPHNNKTQKYVFHPIKGTTQALSKSCNQLDHYILQNLLYNYIIKQYFEAKKRESSRLKNPATR